MTIMDVFGDYERKLTSPAWAKYGPYLYWELDISGMFEDSTTGGPQNQVNKNEKIPCLKYISTRSDNFSTSFLPALLRSLYFW